MQETLHNYPNLDIRAASVHDLVFEHDTAIDDTWGTVTGVRLGELHILFYPQLCLYFVRLGRDCTLLSGHNLYWDISFGGDSYR